MVNTTREPLNNSTSVNFESKLLTQTNRKILLRKKWTLGLSAIIVLVIVPLLIHQQYGFESTFVFIFGIIIIVWAILGIKYYSFAKPRLSNSEKHRGIGRMGLGNTDFMGTISATKKKSSFEISEDRFIDQTSNTIYLFGLILLIGILITILGFFV